MTTTPKIRVVCWETGSAVALAPVMQSLHDRRFEIVVTALDPGLSILRKRCDSFCSFEDGFPTERDECVVLTGVGAPGHKTGWALLTEAGCGFPVICLLDHGKGLERFLTKSNRPVTNGMPDQILVPDSAIVDELVAKGMSSSCFKVTGSPVLAEAVSRGAPDISKRQAIRERLEISPTAYVVLIASEGVHDEHSLHSDCGEGCTTLEHAMVGDRPLLETLRDEIISEGVPEPMFLLRPHPTQTANHVPGSRVVAWSDADELEILSVSDRVYGVSSILLMIAAVLGLDTRSVAERLDAWSPASAYMTPNVWRELSKSGIFGDCPITIETRTRHTQAIDSAAEAVEGFLAGIQQTDPARANERWL